jgi:ferredoxin-NADP reductase/DMSO/TMAO reductase YedYZ heme-binding membrane subunit
MATITDRAATGHAARRQHYEREFRLSRATGVLAGIWAGAAAVLLLWWHDTPPLAGAGDWLTNAGRICGLLAGYGVVILVALMARLPPLERGVGTDRLARWHAMGGRYVISLIVSHAALIICGYAASAGVSPLSEAASVLTTLPDVLMAAVALALLVGIAAVSARAARRRLRYETWYYLHFYTYLAIALAFSHQFADGADFRARPVRIAWSALYLTVAALLAWYRVIAPARLSARHRLRVASVHQEAPGVVSVYLTGARLDELRIWPGQFFRWRFLTRDLWWSSHPYSLSGWSLENCLRITVKDRGDHSGALARLRPGTPILASGPYGALSWTKSRRRVLLLAGGVGITPLRTMFESMPGDVALVYRASSAGDVVFRRELDAVAAGRGTAVHYLLGSRAGLGHDPLSAERLSGMVPGLHRREVYLCGPAGMADAAVSVLQAAGVPRRRIHRESFEFSWRSRMRRALLAIVLTAIGLAVLLSFKS